MKPTPAPSHLARASLARLARPAGLARLLPPSRLARLSLVACLFALCSAPVPTRAQEQPRAAAQIEEAGLDTEITLRWPASPRVTRYRVQVARDARFTDIVYDGVVVGLEHKVTGLLPGPYYWRVAPAPRETGRFSRPTQIEVTRGIAATTIAGTTMTPIGTTGARPGLLKSPRDVGWQTAIGRVQRPSPARLRAGQVTDFVAVNSDGTVYALEGDTGAALWAAKYRPQVRGGGGGASGEAPAEIFTPLIYAAAGRAGASVVAAFDGGVRLLEGETGRELWRVATSGRPVSGSVAELDGNADAPEIVIATNEPTNLYVVEGATGRVVSQTKLQGDVIGVPVPFLVGSDRGVAVAMEGGHLDVRRLDGSRLRGIRFDVPFATPPLIISGPKGALVIIGTQHGLLFVNGADFSPLGRITTEEDSPRGRLAAADLNGDGLIEIVMVTRRGRVAVISAEGQINWSADGGADAYSASFADLNRDGTLDVLVADEGVFARGLSGRDGALIWQADDAPRAGRPNPGGDGKQLRSLAIVPSGAGAPLLVSGDPARNALRAVGLPAAPGSASAK